MDAKRLTAPFTVAELVAEPTLPQGGYRLGFDAEAVPFDITYSMARGHIHILSAADGGGESLVEYLIAQQVARGGGFLRIDSSPTGKTVQRTVSLMKALNRESDLFRLDFDDADANTYNPLNSGRPDEVANRLLSIWQSGAGASHDVYDQQQLGHAVLVILEIVRAAKRLIAMDDLAMLLSSQRTMEFLRTLPMDETHRRVFAGLEETLNETSGNGLQLKSSLASFGETIRLYAQGKFGRVFNTYTPDIDVGDILDGQKALLVSVDVVSRLKPSQDVARLVLHDLRSAVSRRAKGGFKEGEEPPFLVVLPDLCSYWSRSLISLFESAKSANVAIVVMHRNLASAREVDVDFASGAMIATRTRVVFQQPIDDATVIADKLSRWKRLTSTSGEGAQVDGLAESIEGLLRRQAVVQQGERVITVSVPGLWFNNSEKGGKPIPEGMTPLRLADCYKRFLHSVLE